LIDTANANLQIIKQNREKSRDTDIPIGAKGILDSVKWEVIGYMEKRDTSSYTFWDEYLLFNPYFGFRFLVQADGHWNLAGIIKRDYPFAESSSEIILDGEKFSIFNRGQNTVEYVKGEFYWRVRKGAKERYFDYIAPPRMFSAERNDSEVIYSLAEYVPSAEIEKAFGVTLEKAKGVAPNQPPPFFKVLTGIWSVAMLGLVAAFLVQINSGSGEVVHSSRMHIEHGNAERSYSTPSFNVPRRGNLVVQALAPLKNNWIELDLALVNEESNVVHEATQAIEYYYGYEDGESWSEGDNVGETYFSSVDSGNYRLIVDPSPGQIGFDGMDVTLQIKRNMSVWGNFWIIVLLMFALPIYAVCYRWYFEYKLWEQSDYAPSIYRIDSE
jgi:hypothetical protein